MCIRSLAAFTILFSALVFSSISRASSSWYCETGDPGGGGPTATVDVDDKGIYTLGISYNRNDLNSSARSSDFHFKGAAFSTSPTEIGADCVRSTFKWHGKSSIDFTVCGENEYALINLRNFNDQQYPDYEFGCQSN